MSLATRCPSCATAFRVHPTQLSARGGKVRCGKCGLVFDGVTALVAPAVGGEVREGALPPEPSPQLALFESQRNSPPLAAEAANEELAVPQFLGNDVAPRRGWLWGLAALLALIGLSAQVVFHFRSEIGVLAPSWRPTLQQACAALGCEVRLPRQAHNVTIESSEVRGTQKEGVIELVTLIRNLAPFPQELPLLHFSLTDIQTETLASRTIEPGEYLRFNTTGQRPSELAPKSVLEIRLLIDNSELKAVGYKVAIAFARPR